MTSTLPNVVDSIQVDSIGNARKCSSINLPFYEQVLMSLWKHECTRVIADRFTAQEDKDWFETALIDHVRDHLGEEYVQWVEVSHYFVDFMRDAPEPTGDETEEADMELPKVYEPVTSLDDLQERLTMFLAQYNDMVRGLGMDLVFFRDAVEHLIKVTIKLLKSKWKTL
jgi:dynein heavy chain, axonemal